MSKHIAVLKGGFSTEREVSLMSGAAVERALRELGYKVTSIDVDRDIARTLQLAAPDIAFNALHGRYGEDGAIQGILEVLEIAYTHSGVLASALAMDKPMAKKVFAAAGLRCAKGAVFHKHDLMKGDPMARPYVVKPINEGSSVGVTIVFPADDFQFSEDNWGFGEYVLVEEFIAGREIQVAVLDDAALGAIEIRLKDGFYDYEAKYTDGRAQHIMPAPIAPHRYEEVCALALKAHRALGCRGLSRSDFRYNEAGDGEFYLLELNNQPGMTPLSLSPEIAAHAGISFNELIERLINGAKLGA